MKKVRSSLRYGMVLFLVLSHQAIAGNEPQSESEAISRIRATTSEHEKREMVLAWTQKTAQMTGKARSLSTQTVSADDLLALCLQDESPVVVAEAAAGVGRVGAKKFENELIALHADAQKRFGGYAERVRFAIIKALGATGSDKTTRLFAKLLENDNGSVTGSELLEAIKTLGDPALTADLNRYAEKLDGYIIKAKELKYDPMSYSMLERNAALARELAVTLGNGKGE